ncbi:MAG TPA: HEAT repeat domain-containing protein [Thermoanaerobaculia bacterium]|nr:HEAT repeat domain-containing protein [Thermoanaerobaculia bacterium]
MSFLGLMGSVIGILIGARGLWSLGTFWSGHRDGRRRLRVWQHAAASGHLQVVEAASSSARLKLVARAGPLEVRIEAPRSSESSLQVVVVPGLPGFSDVRIRRPLPQMRGIEVGDEPFDSTFYVGGPPRLVCALLDAEVRRLLLSMNTKGRLEIVDGEIQAETSDRQLSYLLPRLLDLGHRFSRPRDVTLRLVRNARRDPVPEVRLQNLILLVREFPENPATVKVLRRAGSDSSPKVRLWAGRELGAEGRDVLMQLAASEEDDDYSAQAVSALGLELTFEHTRAILVQALRRRHIQTVRACLEVLGRSGTAAAVKALAKVVVREKGEVAVAAAQALGAAGSAAAEPPLIQALQHKKAEVRVAAAKELGRLGSAAAVLPLQEAAERSPRDQEIGEATRQAITEIQSRLPAASPGQLSLAAPEVGRLSLLQAEVGQLSLATDPAGQLSLPPGEPKT